MQLGVDGVFVGSGIFMSEEPLKRAKAIVRAVTHFKDAKIIAEVSENLGRAMTGISDLQESRVNFRDREAGESKPAQTKPQRKAHGGSDITKLSTTTSMPGSDWVTNH